MAPDLGAAASLLLGVVFIWAGASKLASPSTTASSFAGLRLPAPRLLGLAVPVVELMLGGLLVAGVPGVSVAAIVLLAGFSAVLGRTIARGERVACACFGAGGAAPVSWLDLVRNLLLAGLAVGATASDGRWPSLPALVLVSCVVAVGRVSLGVADLARSAPLWPGAPER